MQGGDNHKINRLLHWFQTLWIKQVASSCAVVHAMSNIRVFRGVCGSVANTIDRQRCPNLSVKRRSTGHLTAEHFHQNSTLFLMFASTRQAHMHTDSRCGWRFLDAFTKTQNCALQHHKRTSRAAQTITGKTRITSATTTNSTHRMIKTSQITAATFQRSTSIHISHKNYCDLFSNLTFV